MPYLKTQKMEYGAPYKKVFKALPFFIHLAVLIGVAQGQNLSTYSIRQIPLPDVYANRNITDVCQDRLGVLWISTMNGLYVCDGIRAIPYQPSAQARLAGVPIHTIAEDAQGYLWLRTSNGPQLLSAQRDHYLSPAAIGIPDSIWQADNFNFCKGSKNDLFLFAGHTIFTYSKGTLKIWRQLPEKIWRPNTFQIHYSPLHNHFHFVSFYTRKFYIYKQTGAPITDFKIKNADQSPVWKYPGLANLYTLYSRAFSDSVSMFYISGFEWNERAYYMKMDLPQKTITIDNGQLDKNAIPFLPAVRKLILDTDTLQDQHDLFGNLKIERLQDGSWAISNRSGFFLAEKKQGPIFSKVAASLGQRIRAIHQDRYGHLIYGTYDGIFWQKKDAKAAARLSQSPLSTWSICPLNRQKDHFVAEGEDLYKRLFLLKTSPQKVWIEKIDSSLKVPGLDAYAMAMAFDPDKNGYWHTVGQNPDYDLAFFNAQSFRHHILRPRLENIAAKAMVMRKGNLWIGGADGLRVVVNPDPQHGFLNDQSNVLPPFIKQQSVNALFNDKQNNLWIATNSNGLLCYQPESGRYQQYTTADGLPENTVFSILAEPGDTVLWLGTGNGLSRFEVDLQTFSNFYAQDGLCHNEFNTGSAYRDADGTLYMGGQNGISYFHPDSFHAQLQPPRQFAIVTLTGLDPNTDTYRTILGHNAKITIPQNIKLIEFAFTSDHYLHNEQVQFRYRIPGLIDVWQYLNHTGTALFPLLPSGKYFMEVQVKSYRGIWGQPVQYALDILPKWYETWWFRLSILLALAVTLYALYLFRIRQLRREFELRQQISHDLHDSLGSRIYLLRSLSNQIANPLLSDKEKNERLGKFESISQDTFQSIRDFIWAFDPKQDQVSQLFDRMDDFAENYLSPLVPEVKVHRVDPSTDLKIDPKTKHHLINIYQELLTNMVKHTHTTAIEVSLSCQGEYLHIDIRNWHKGYKSPQQEISDALKAGQESMANRLNTIHAQLEWQEPTDHLQQALLRVRV